MLKINLNVCGKQHVFVFPISFPTHPKSLMSKQTSVHPDIEKVMLTIRPKHD